MKKTLFFIIILVFTIQKSKADVCDSQADADVAANVLGLLSSPPDWKKLSSIVASSSNIAGLVSSIFGRQGDTTCALNKKLDEILNKLGDIQSTLREISSDVKCEPIKRNLLIINQKIHTLTAIRNKKNEEFISALKGLCSDPTEGINKIYSNFEIFYFEPQSVGDYIKNCASYDARRTSLMGALAKSYAGISALITSCEKAYGIQQFDIEVFKNDMKKFTDYYTEFYIYNRFANDQDENGLKKSVKRILDTFDDAKSARQNLKEKYDFYEWDVIYYSSEVRGFDKHTSLVSGNSWKNGAFHFIGKVKGDKKTGFASWCLKNTNKPDYMNKYQNKQYEMKVASDIDDAEEYVDTIWKKNYGDANFNYLLCVVDDKVIISKFLFCFRFGCKVYKTRYSEQN